MRQLQPVRGTHDVLPDEMRRHRRVAETARVAAELYGFHEIATPLFEFSEVFRRSLGETSDIVAKEMYTFTDRSGDEITLRPENTAGVCRAVVSQGLGQQLPLKFFYYGPMFRHERPQKGRLRQFNQIGVELIGIAEPLADIEVIAVGAYILDRLGVLERTTLEINTLGDLESRAAYRAVLVEFLRRHESRLSEDSRKRLERNPLRILDSKDADDRRIIAEAPPFSEYLNEDSKRFFASVLAGLDRLAIRYAVNARLVRGLDYYCHTAFEFITDTLGAQGTVMGGGRYDGLIAEMGGPSIPGIGWAAGVERLAMMLDDAPPPARPIAIIPVGADCEGPALELAERLRRSGTPIELGYRGNVSKRMKAANRARARAAILIGEDEMRRGAVTLRDLDSGEQAEVPLADLRDRLAQFL
ncbi:MAG TPA: histidine--tRNA ligase [Alphaproteobacteria bacterium]|nr:histidine--tRNA ligase [Alphaproteobacteria bacterium]